MNTFKSYIKYPCIDVSKASLEECINHDAKIKEIRTENQAVKKHNDSVVDEFRSLFSNRGKKKDRTDYSWFCDALKAMGLPHASSPTEPYAKDIKGDYIKVGDVLQNHKQFTFETFKLTLDERNKKIMIAEETALREKARADDFIASEAEIHGISIDDFSSTKDFIRAVKHASREKWVEDNYPAGTEMDIKCCDECSTWTVGERRCECENRRIDLCVEFVGGDEKWYAYAEAY